MEVAVLQDKFIDIVKVASRKYHWNMIQAGYEILKLNKKQI
jgi:hypothetical protein